MGRDVRVDDYVARAEPFARPILTTIRERLHAACPDLVERIRWSMPHFDHAGRPFAGMAAFKAHASFGFWRHAEVTGAPTRRDAMGQFGRLTRVEDLPDEAAFAALVRAAMAVTGAGPAKREPKHPKPLLAEPPEIAAAVAAGGAFGDHWAAFPPGARRDYLDWIAAARRPDTRARRLATTLADVAEGRRHNWRYQTR